MATGKTIESIWSGDVLTWYLPTNYKDAPHPPIGALKAWAVDAGLRDGDKIVLHHVASVGEVVSRPDGIKDRAIGIRRTTKTASMSGYMVVNAPEQAQLPGDVPVPTATTEWLARRAVTVEKSLPDLQTGVMTVDQVKAVIGEVSPETTLKEMVEAADHKGCEIHIQLTPTKVASQDVIEEPATEPALSAIDMIARGEGEVLLADAADYLRITVEQAEQLIDEGALVGRCVGEVWYVDAASVAKFVQCGSLHDLANVKTKEDADDVAAIEARRDEPIIPLSEVPNDVDMSNMALFTALDNANERLHGDIARLNVDNSTLRQCLGRLQGAIEAKTGVDVSEHMVDPVALTKALIAALAPRHKPCLAPIATGMSTEEASRILQGAMPHFAIVASPKPEIQHNPTIDGNEIIAMQYASATAVAPKVDVNATLTDEGIKIVAKTTATTNGDLFDRAKVAGDDLKVMLREMDVSQTGSPSTLQPETNYFFDDVHKNHRMPG